MEIEKTLNNICNDVRFDPMSRTVYSVDASIYEVKPQGVVLPKSCEELREIVRVARDHQMPITARGAATGITGGAIGEGLIIDCTHLNKTLEINKEEKYALVEPGVVQDTLNAALAPFGYRLGPDTSTGDRATLGGMLANNAAGARSLKFGQMSDHVLGVELVLANGDIVWLDETTTGPLRKELERIRDLYDEEIKKGYPNIPRAVSGYNVRSLLEEPLNLAKILVGSEGTLGIATKIKVSICPIPKIAGLRLIPFKTMLEAMQAVPKLLALNPLSLEMIDHHIINAANPEWLDTTPEALLIAEFEEEDTLNNLEEGFAVTDPKEQAAVWSLRKSGLGLLLSKRSYSRAIAFIEDVAVPPECLTRFMEAFIAKVGRDAGIYGHVGAGCLHIRPYIDLRGPNAIEEVKKIMLDIADLLKEYGGSLSGEHGDGLIRSWLNPHFFGEKLTQCFIEIKEAFDPTYLLNPGKIVRGKPLEEQIRKSPPPRDSQLNFDGGFSLSVDLCNGNGKCRKMEGTMCPSFQATQDEFNTTRARAQALRAAIRGDFPLASKEVHDVLDLCLECKACKTECPSGVDMTKMKAEFLYHYGVSFRSRLFGYIGQINRWLKPLMPLMNKPLQKWLGIAPERDLPKIAQERFSHWAKKQPERKGGKEVVLFSDTFTEFHEPEVGKAAYQALVALGFSVIVPPWSCCGRTYLSKGLLNQAKRAEKKLEQLLSPYLHLPIIGLEPSCILTIKDDYEGKISEQAIPFDTFIAQELKKGNFPFKQIEKPFLLHGHCHQKSLVGTDDTLKVLRALTTESVAEIPSGCCGMAGSFGYEKEHYDISMKIGELQLFPALRKASEDTQIVADGFSCRCQISHGTPRSGYHLATFLQPRDLL